MRHNIVAKLTRLNSMIHQGNLARKRLRSNVTIHHYVQCTLLSRKFITALFSKSQRTRKGNGRLDQRASIKLKVGPTCASVHVPEFTCHFAFKTLHLHSIGNINAITRAPEGCLHLIVSQYVVHGPNLILLVKYCFKFVTLPMDFWILIAEDSKVLINLKTYE